MSLIDYDDFLFSSEDEYRENDFDADEEEIFDLDADEEEVFDHDSDEDRDDDRDEDGASELSADIDEYESFFTDLEKYQYDQVRWGAIPNSRKYPLAKKQTKDRKEGVHRRNFMPKKEVKKEVKSTRNKKSQKERKPKAPPKSRAKRTSKKEQPMEQEVEISGDGEIHFDSRDDLWYSYKKNERATFHHWIRADLSRIENNKGTYDFPRQRGAGNYDVTCYNEVQEHWGLERAHYAPVMFEWERVDRKDPTYPLDSLYHQGLLVIDYWRMPVRNFREIPLVISSTFEGGYMEPATRLHSEMGYEDFRARMPPFLEIRVEDEVQFKALSKASTFSGRSRHFREEAGAISWDKREGSINIKNYIQGIVKPVGNSTAGSRNLTKDEIKRLRLINHGTKPARAKPGTTQESKQRYITSTRKAAGITDANLSPPIADDQNADEQELAAIDDEVMVARGADQRGTDHGWRVDYIQYHNNLYDDDYDGFVENPMASIEDVTEQTDTAPPRFVFCRTAAPFLQALTEDQASAHPLVNMSDPRNQVPKFIGELFAIRDALQVTIDHFKEIVGAEPQVSEGANYISEYCNIQDQMDDVFLNGATALRRLGRWEGTMADWEQAEVQDDPCVGRRTQPF